MHLARCYSSLNKIGRYPANATESACIDPAIATESACIDKESPRIVRYSNSRYHGQAASLQMIGVIGRFNESWKGFKQLVMRLI